MGMGVCMGGDVMYVTYVLYVAYVAAQHISHIQHISYMRHISHIHSPKKNIRGGAPVGAPPRIGGYLACSRLLVGGFNLGDAGIGAPVGLRQAHVVVVTPLCVGFGGGEEFGCFGRILLPD